MDSRSSKLLSERVVNPYTYAVYGEKSKNYDKRLITKKRRVLEKRNLQKLIEEA